MEKNVDMENKAVAENKGEAKAETVSRAEVKSVTESNGHKGKKEASMETKKSGRVDSKFANVLELDKGSEVLTYLGLDTEESLLKEANNLTNLSAAERLKYSDPAYYQKLQDNKEQIVVRFSGCREKRRRNELFVLYGDLELVYPIETFEESGELEVTEAAPLLDKDYRLYVQKVLREEKRIVLSDTMAKTRSQAIDLINKKLESNEEIYLRGNIIGLQKNSWKNTSEMAAYVNIEGLGIIGVVPIKQWSVGFTATGAFRSTVENNKNAIINFKVVAKTSIPFGKSSRPAYVCSRRGYLEKINYDPWKIVEKTLTKRSTVLVKIVEEGKSEASFFGAIDGIVDFNMLCYKDDNSPLKLGDICVGQYYYGYVQKMDVAKKFLRVRLTHPAKGGSALKEISD